MNEMWHVFHDKCMHVFTSVATDNELKDHVTNIAKYCQKIECLILTRQSGAILEVRAYHALAQAASVPVLVRHSQYFGPVLLGRCAR
jgi:hypothetical protein